MFGFPASTEFGKRIPKQKFYENIDITPALKRVFADLDAAKLVFADLADHIPGIKLYAVQKLH